MPRELTKEELYKAAVEAALAQLSNATYRESVRQYLSPYPIGFQLRILKFNNDYILREKPNMTKRLIHEIEANLSKKDIIALIQGDWLLYRDEPFQAEMICDTLGRLYKRTDNKELGLWVKEILDIFFTIDKYDSFERLGKIGINIYNRDGQDRIMKALTEYNRRWPPGFVNKWLSENRFKEVEWNFF